MRYPRGSDLERLFIIKFLFPFVVVLGMTLVLRGAHHVVELVLPIALWTAFNLSVAQIKAGDQGVRYRRFLKWKGIPYREIRECKVSWAPAMGYMNIGRFVPPWGKIYFVLDGGLHWAFPGGQTKLTALISARAAGEELTFPVRNKDGEEHTKRSDVQACVVAFVAGAVLSFFIPVLFPSAPVRINPQTFP